MKKEEIIKDFYGHFLGIIEYCDNGDQIAKIWQSRQIVGFYRKKFDHTTDFYGRVVSKGNTVIALIYKNLK
jgi:hypothetical protein